MPIYEYRCETCGYVFEELQRFSDPDPEQCPKCKAEQVQRLISNSSFHLKGSGWYVTDYKSSSSSSGTTTSSSESGTSTGSSSSSDGTAA